MKKRIEKKYIIFTLILLLILCRVIFGRITIRNIFGYPSSNNRYFEVMINDSYLPDVPYTLTSYTPIIPFVLYLKSTYSDSSLHDEPPITGHHTVTSEKVILDVKSYECYYGKYRVKCKYNDDYKRKYKDIKLSKLTIFRTDNKHGVVYSGKYKNDISKYLTKKGQYNIKIGCNYNNTQCEMNFYIIKK